MAEPSPELVELAHRMFDLAREGAAELAERGADVNRLNDRGQSPLAGAGHRGDVRAHTLTRHRPTWRRLPRRAVPR